MCVSVGCLSEWYTPSVHRPHTYHGYGEKAVKALILKRGATHTHIREKRNSLPFPLSRTESLPSLFPNCQFPTSAALERRDLSSFIIPYALKRALSYPTFSSSSHDPNLVHIHPTILMEICPPIFQLETIPLGPTSQTSDLGKTGRTKKQGPKDQKRIIETKTKLTTVHPIPLNSIFIHPMPCHQSPLSLPQKRKTPPGNSTSQSDIHVPQSRKERTTNKQTDD
ncbi:hypothetical protein QBC44DRAFT_154821 [Cladorrhinum sp. PSN332]|nr:hypothetical protein QBC44DRAFT_154821 [Cladorrhinum sp. PSN332]